MPGSVASGTLCSCMTSLRVENRGPSLVSAIEWDFPLTESVQIGCGVHLSTDSVLFVTRVYVNLTIHFHLVLKSRMSGVILSFPSARSLSAQGKMYLQLTLRVRVILTAELRVLIPTMGHSEIALSLRHMARRIITVCNAAFFFMVHCIVRRVNEVYLRGFSTQTMTVT
jgi:hypothetical protein